MESKKKAKENKQKAEKVQRSGGNLATLEKKKKGDGRFIISLCDEREGRNQQLSKIQIPKETV